MAKWMGPTEASFNARRAPRSPFALIENPITWLIAGVLLLLCVLT